MCLQRNQDVPVPAIPEVQRLQAAHGDRAACGQKKRGGREAVLLTRVWRLQEEVIGNSLVLRGEESGQCGTAGGLA